MARNLKLNKCNLSNLLKQKGFTAKNLGDYLGVSYQQVLKYNSGQNEMSLKTLLEACKFLDCNPIDIYPEIEMYDKGFSIPKTQKLLSETVLKKLQSEELSSEEISDIIKRPVVINHTENNTTNVHKSNFLEDFFNNIRLLDINARGALLFKIAVALIVIDAFVYVGFRLFGHVYAPFIGGDGLSGQLMWQIVVFTFPLSFILPLLLKHWSIYILTFSTFHGIQSLLYGGLLHITANHILNNEVDPHTLWLIKGAIALVLTLGYAWIVKTYLRNPSKREMKTS